jgi:hypothetical protein
MSETGQTKNNAADGRLAGNGYCKHRHALDRHCPECAGEQQKELSEWKQAAAVEASLRRKFLARAEAAEAALTRLQQSNAELVALVKGAYSEGFSEGMREHTSSKGGKPWVDSAAKTKLEAIASQSSV